MHDVKLEHQPRLLRPGDPQVADAWRRGRRHSGTGADLDAAGLAEIEIGRLIYVQAVSLAGEPGKVRIARERRRYSSPLRREQRGFVDLTETTHRDDRHAGDVEARVRARVYVEAAPDVEVGQEVRRQRVANPAQRADADGRGPDATPSARGGLEQVLPPRRAATPTNPADAEVLVQDEMNNGPDRPRSGDPAGL